MSKPKIRVSDLRAEAQRLIATGKMPTLDQLLSVVADVRMKYAVEIKKAQRSK